MHTLRQLNQAGRTIIIVTHDTRLAAEYASRVVVMANGEIVADGPPSSIFYDAKSMDAAALRAPPIVELATALAAPGTTPGILTVREFLAGISGSGRASLQ
jgi:energy-coupling factor transport system ATP-binding protein